MTTTKQKAKHTTSGPLAGRSSVPVGQKQPPSSPPPPTPVALMSLSPGMAGPPSHQTHNPPAHTVCVHCSVPAEPLGYANGKQSCLQICDVKAFGELSSHRGQLLSVMKYQGPGVPQSQTLIGMVLLRVRVWAAFTCPNGHRPLERVLLLEWLFRRGQERRPRGRRKNGEPEDLPHRWVMLRPVCMPDAPIKNIQDPKCLTPGNDVAVFVTNPGNLHVIHVSADSHQVAHLTLRKVTWGC